MTRCFKYQTRLLNHECPELLFVHTHNLSVFGVVGIFFSCFVFYSLFFLSDTHSFGAINIIVSQDSLRNWCFMRMYLIILFWSMRIRLWRSKKRGLLFFFYLPLPPAPFVSSPEKLDVEKVVSIDQLKKKISPALLYKETYLGAKEGKWR